MVYRRTPPIQQRIDDQRATVVRAAIDQLRDGGYGACSVAAVAVRAGVATGTVYRHVAGKQELIAEAFRHVVAAEVAAVRATTGTSGAIGADASASGRLAAVVETFASRALKSPRLAYALLVEPLDPGIEQLRLRFRVEFADIIAGILADGVRSGEFPPQPVDVTSAAIVGAIAESLVGPLANPDAPAPGLIDFVITFVSRAAGGRDAHP